MLAGLISVVGIIAFFVVFFRKWFAVESSNERDMPMKELSVLSVTAP